MKKDKKKILFFDHDPKISGSTISLRYIIVEFIKEGFEVYLLTPKKQKYLENFKELEVNVIISSSSKFKSFALSTHFSDHYSFFSINWLITFIKNLLRLFVGSIITIKTLKTVKPDLIYINEHNMYYCSIIAKLLGIKSVIHIRSNFKRGIFGISEKIMAKSIFHSNEYIFAITEIEANQIRKYNLDSKRKIIVLPEFLSTEDFICEKSVNQVRQEFSLPLNKIIVISFVGIDRLKGSIEYLESIKLVLKKNSNVYFILAGEIKNTGAIKGVKDYYIKAHNLLSSITVKENLKIVGFTENQHELIFASDILISPFQRSHFSRPIIEAWALKRPIITSDIPHSRSYILDEVDGLFFQDVQSLSEKIILLATDQSLREKLSTNGYNKAKKTFLSEVSLPIVIQKINKILNF